jgi:hypothetical protein
MPRQRYIVLQYNFSSFYQLGLLFLLSSHTQQGKHIILFFLSRSAEFYSIPNAPLRKFLSFFRTYSHTFHRHLSPFNEVPLCFFITGSAQRRETSMWLRGRESNLVLPYSSPMCWQLSHAALFFPFIPPSFIKQNLPSALSCFLFPSQFPLPFSYF